MCLADQLQFSGTPPLPLTAPQLACGEGSIEDTLLVARCFVRVGQRDHAVAVLDGGGGLASPFPSTLRAAPPPHVRHPRVTLATLHSVALAADCLLKLKRTVDAIALLSAWLGREGSAAEKQQPALQQLLTPPGSEVPASGKTVAQWLAEGGVPGVHLLHLLQCLPSSVGAPRRALARLCFLRCQAHAAVQADDISEDHGRSMAGVWGAVALCLDPGHVEAVDALADGWLLPSQREQQLQQLLHTLLQPSDQQPQRLQRHLACAHSDARLHVYDLHRTPAGVVQPLLRVCPALALSAGVLAAQAEVAFHQHDMPATLALTRTLLSRHPHHTGVLHLHFAALLNLAAGVPSGGVIGIGPSAANTAAARQATTASGGLPADPMAALMGAGTSKSRLTQAVAGASCCLQTTHAWEGTATPHQGRSITPWAAPCMSAQTT